MKNIGYDYRIKDVLLLALITRAIQYSIIYLTPCQFDTSTSILINEFMGDLSSSSRYPSYLNGILSNLMSWDSVYYLKGSLQGINFEHEWVFTPFMNKIINFLVTKYDLNIFDIQLFLTLFNNSIVIFITYLIYQLTYIVFKDKKMAYYSSLLIIVQPSGIFSMVSYPETIVQCLDYLALICYFKSRNSKTGKHILYLFSGTLIALSYGFRSNCLLYGLIYLYDLFVSKNIKEFAVVTVTGLELFFTAAFSIYLPYSLYCPARGEWCNSWNKSLITYSQSHYWNNGFLSYFTSGNIPLFVISIPQFLVLILSVKMFYKNKDLRSLIFMSVIYLFLQFTVFHVQIINRISTFLPIQYWYVSKLIANNNNKAQLIVNTWIFWIFLQTALFSMFLPPA